MHNKHWQRLLITSTSFVRSRSPWMWKKPRKCWKRQSLAERFTRLLSHFVMVTRSANYVGDCNVVTLGNRIIFEFSTTVGTVSYLTPKLVGEKSGGWQAAACCMISALICLMWRGLFSGL